MSKSVSSRSLGWVWWVGHHRIEGVGRTAADAWLDAHRRCLREYEEAQPPYESSWEDWWSSIESQLTWGRFTVDADAESAVEQLLRLLDPRASERQGWRTSLKDGWVSGFTEVWGYWVQGHLLGLGADAESARDDARLRLEQSLLPSFCTEAWRRLGDAVRHHGQAVQLQLPQSSARRLMWALTAASSSAWPDWKETFDLLLPGEWQPTDSTPSAEPTSMTVQDLLPLLTSLEDSTPLWGQVACSPLCVPLTAQVRSVYPGPEGEGWLGKKDSEPGPAALVFGVVP